MMRYRNDDPPPRSTPHFRLVTAPSAVATEARSRMEIEANILHALATAAVRSPASVTATIGPIIGVWDAHLWDHSCMVAEYAAALAAALPLPSDHIAAIRVAGLLHDIGKIALPVAILRKPGALTPDEYAIVRRHPEVGRRMLVAVSAPPTVVAMVSDHHERWDGTGYPVGKAGKEIGVGGRVLAVADTLDTILRDREYSRGKPLAWALMEITRCAGSQFDPAVVAALHCLVERRGRGYFQAAVGMRAFRESGQRRAAGGRGQASGVGR